MQAAGTDIDSHCGKCRLELAHVIVAAQNGQAKRVQCKTCGSVHNHRAKTATASRSGPPKAKAAGAGKSQKARAQSAGSFDEAIKGRDLTRPLRYKPSLTLTHEAIVDHPRFGLGIVTRVLADGKASVLFADAERTLVHSRA